MSTELERELTYHEKLYSGFAQAHFAKPAVRAVREHLVRRILEVTGATANSRVLSVGCGIGDTELVLARHVGEVVGVDLSPSAIGQAQADAKRLGVLNFRGVCGTLEEAAASLGQFDAVIAIFFLHHLPNGTLEAFPVLVRSLLREGGTFYALDPSKYRLSGFIGELLFPKLMARYQSPGERQLAPEETARLFGGRHAYYDFVSTPLAGLFPSWRGGYQMARMVDEGLIRMPGLRKVSSNFEVIARRDQSTFEGSKNEALSGGK